MTDFRMTFEGDSAVLSGGPNELRSLCRKEVDRFDEYLRRTDPQFRDGLARWERLAVEGYLYQKVKGHLDEDNKTDNLPVERDDGTTTST
jgi:hypothetical protein